MTFDEIWQQLMQKRPALNNDNATIEFKASNLRALLQQVYDQGCRASPPSFGASFLDSVTLPGQQDPPFGGDIAYGGRPYHPE